MLDPKLQAHLQQVVARACSSGDFDGAFVSLMEGASTLEKSGRAPEAVGVYEFLLRLEDRPPLDPSIQPKLTRALTRLKPQLFHKLAEHHLRQNQTEQALAYLKKSLDLKPGQWQVHMTLGKIHAGRQAYKEAIGQFQEVLRLSPDNSGQAYLMLGEIFVRQGRSPQQTLDWFVKAVRAFHQAHQGAEAQRAYQRMTQLDPQHPSLQEVRQLLSGSSS